MPAIAHAYRRGATYTWRRRIPQPLCRFCKGEALIVSLGTRDPRRARFLAGQLTAHSDDMFQRAMANADPDIVMTRRQLDGVFRESLLAHLDKLDRVAAAERADPNFDPDDSRRCDHRMGWVFRLLAGRGAAAFVDDGTAAKMAEQGLSREDVAEVSATLAAMIAQGAHRMPQQRLEALLINQEAPATSVNLSLAQEVTFRAMATAAFATERRYDGARIEDEAKLDAIVLGEVTAITHPFAPLTDAAASQSPTTASKPVPQRAKEAADRASDRPSSPRQPSPRVVSLENHPVIEFGEAMIAARARDEDWDTKTQVQARQIFTLFAKLLFENNLVDVADLRQSHFADLVGLLRAVSPSYGKSPKDQNRTTAELRAVGAKLAPEARGISGATLNRHLTFLGQLLTYLKAQGLPLDPGISVALLRAKTKNRARNKRAALTNEDVGAIFRLTCFTGCKSWRQPFEPGPDTIHRALYFAIILLYYTGARREKICGLHVDDVGELDGVAYIDIRRNQTRRVKNDQSVRYIALHPEILRLGFLDYVQAIKNLGYSLVFPDLKSPSSRAPLGDRLYDEFLEGMKIAIPDAAVRKKVIHSFRHALGNNLKQARVHTEIRADILGHGGKGETDERYCDPIALRSMLADLIKLPAVTAHLDAQPIRLLGWVSDKKPAPFARQSKRAAKGASPR
ncbi:DUF6538 domain-containing protein [Methylorubrum sp. SL192]|uniref:DUF6538 domain-containing protein n=1 Tax=Methylorubrum sp. SL192 TaxID=2995167 RepID=UPI002275984C|nr:DUF6538 domain-containing protein [Methylorubrum sp. SL192]MCY1644065.1 tyrosine-type recombinase/integrase [Methylorubrum sp. SL192]